MEVVAKVEPPELQEVHPINPVFDTLAHPAPFPARLVRVIDHEAFTGKRELAESFQSDPLTWATAKRGKRSKITPPSMLRYLFIGSLTIHVVRV